MTKKNLLCTALLLFLSILNFSCKSGEKKADAAVSADGKSVAVPNGTPSMYNALIKTDKKKQSELDLPFRGFDMDKQITTIATGSCADQNQPQPIWATIEKNNPDIFIFSGDTLCVPRPDAKGSISEQYRKLKMIPEFRSIREKVPFMAIWNDHDYGLVNGGGENPDKELARTEFIKHWSYLKTALTNKQKGLYHSKIFGSNGVPGSRRKKGIPKQKQVQVIVLDTRWDRSELKKNTDDKFDPKAPATEPATIPRPYLADAEKGKHILSNEQWNWLEQELKKPADLRIIVSPIQVIADDHNFEKWGNFPNEREKLFVLLQKTKLKNVILLSGDRHLGAIAQIEVKKNGPIVEMTTSGLNRPASPNNILTDKTYFKDAYGGPNFGLIKIDWSKHTATLQVKSLEDEVKNSFEVKF
ncbi:MAG: alkaline phosphatase family protein [Bdellovibrio sp.]|nr:alkaline phosphatase family protein [Bdellovibrio sp.]